MLSLGVDLGYAKVKLCLGAPGKTPTIVTRPLPYEARRPHDRGEDIERGLREALSQTLGEAAERREPDVVVAVTSAGYAYRSHREGVVHLAGLLQGMLPRSRAFLLGATLVPVPAAEASRGEADVVGPLALSNPCGAAVLARRLGMLGPGGQGLVLDTGGQTTGTLVLDGERCDPAALASPERYVAHRAESGKLVWVGVETTALESLAVELKVRGRRHEVTGRGVPFQNVSALLGLVPREHAARLALFGLWPGRPQALRAIADAVGLDLELSSEDELLAIAHEFHTRAVDRLARGLKKAQATAPVGARWRAACFGLGASGLARPALARLGLEGEAVALGSERIAAAHADAASCFGAWHAGLELLAGGPVEVLGAGRAS